MGRRLTFCVAMVLPFFLTGCETVSIPYSPLVSAPELPPAKNRGEGTKKTIAGSPEEVSAAILKTCESMNYLVSKGPGGAVRCRDSQMALGWVFYLSPASDPVHTKLEIGYEQAGIDAALARQMEDAHFFGISIRVTTKRNENEIDRKAAAAGISPGTRGGQKRVFHMAKAELRTGILQSFNTIRQVDNSWIIRDEGDTLRASYEAESFSISYTVHLSPGCSPGGCEVEVEYASSISPGVDSKERSEKQWLLGLPESIRLGAFKRQGSDSSGEPPSKTGPSAPMIAQEPLRPPVPYVHDDEPPGPKSPRKPSGIDRLPAPKPERSEDFALIVGIERYQSVSFPADYGEKDAASARLYFRWMGVPEENIISLLGQKAGRSGIAKYLEEWLPRNVTPESRVYFYFSGHGSPDPGTGTAHILPWDGDPAFLKTTALPLAWVYEKLVGLQAKEVVVFIDACFSGEGGKSVLAKGARPLVNVAPAVASGPRLSVLTASTGKEITGSLDEQEHGMFTYFLLQGLRGEADRDRNGHISLEELHTYLVKRVQRAARRQNREQTPQLQTQSRGLFLY